MSWSVSKILKPFKNLAVVYYQYYWAVENEIKPDDTLRLVF